MFLLGLQISAGYPHMSSVSCMSAREVLNSASDDCCGWLLPGSHLILFYTVSDHPAGYPYFISWMQESNIESRNVQGLFNLRIMKVYHLVFHIIFAKECHKARLNSKGNKYYPPFLIRKLQESMVIGRDDVFWQFLKIKYIITLI